MARHLLPKAVTVADIIACCTGRIQEKEKEPDAFAAVLIYGGIMNPAAAFMVSPSGITAKTLFAYYITGLPMDLVHGFGTALFILFAAEPMLEKMDRIKVKYGMVE